MIDINDFERRLKELAGESRGYVTRAAEKMSVTDAAVRYCLRNKTVSKKMAEKLVIAENAIDTFDDENRAGTWSVGMPANRSRDKSVTAECVVSRLVEPVFFLHAVARGSDTQFFIRFVEDAAQNTKKDLVEKAKKMAQAEIFAMHSRSAEKMERREYVNDLFGIAKNETMLEMMSLSELSKIAEINEMVVDQQAKAVSDAMWRGASKEEISDIYKSITAESVLDKQISIVRGKIGAIERDDDNLMKDQSGRMAFHAGKRVANMTVRLKILEQTKLMLKAMNNNLLSQVKSDYSDLELADKRLSRV